MNTEKDWFEGCAERQGSRRGKFVRSLVFFSGTVGVSCGAMTEGGPSEDGATPSSGGGPFGPTGGESQASGGLVTAGGSPSTGGDLIVSSGGQLAVDPNRPTAEWPKLEGFAGAAGAGGGFGIYECTPAQTTCDSTLMMGCNGTQYIDPAECSCDPERPRDESECGADETFVCFEATPRVGSQKLTETAISCICASGAPSCEMCGEAAPELQGWNLPCETDSESRRVLCGCAVIVLR